MSKQEEEYEYETESGEESDEEEEVEPFHQWLWENTKSMAKTGSQYGQVAAGFAGNTAWVVGTSALVLALPLLFAVEAERYSMQVAKMEQQMQQAQARPGAAPAPGAVAAAAAYPQK